MDRRRIDELDGYRVVMVFLVSWFHIWQQSWLTPHIGRTSLDFLVRAGYMPVDATILLSGFLLFLPYVEARRDGRPEPAAGDFYLRRVARTWPSLALVTLLMLFFFAIPQNYYRDAGTMAGDIAAHLTYTSLPIGGESTNCVLAAHTGYIGRIFFDYIRYLNVGDEVTVTNLWNKLTYRVTDKRVYKKMNRQTAISNRVRIW